MFHYNYMYLVVYKTQIKLIIRINKNKTCTLVTAIYVQLNYTEKVFVLRVNILLTIWNNYFEAPYFCSKTEKKNRFKLLAMHFEKGLHLQGHEAQVAHPT